MFDAAQERVARELKSFVGWGARGPRLLARPHLRALAERKYPDIANDDLLLAEAIRHELRQAVAMMRSEREGESIRELLVLSRRYEYKSAVARREDVIQRLGFHCSVARFREDDGPEIELMRSFASSVLRALRST